jgi:hypothetical protein
MVNYAVEKDSAAIANMEEEGRIVMVKGGLERGAIHEWKVEIRPPGKERQISGSFRIRRLGQ